MHQSVSVIIPACNEEKYIARTLESVAENSYPKIETIVVCDGCTDRTADVAKRFKVRLYSVKQRKASAAKNKGAKHASADYYIFLDADTTMSSNAVSEIMELLQEKDTVGSLRVKPYPSKMFARFLMFFKNIAFLLHLYKGTNGLIFCRKSLFDKVKGFDAKLARYEDGDFMYRAMKHVDYTFIRSSFVENSIRRFEKKGYFSVMFFWVKVWFRHRIGNVDDGEYEIIR